jgi:3-oxoacyl-[acyl-carrier protein] reductase
VLLADTLCSSVYCSILYIGLGTEKNNKCDNSGHNIRVTALTPSTVVTDLAIDTKLVSGNEENVMHPEDLTELIVASLKLNPRVLVKTAGLWSTNP